MKVLIEQEIALHQYSVRQNQEEVHRLLHPSFYEIGRSGREFDFDQILLMMKQEQPSSSRVHSQDYKCQPLESNVQLLTYKTAVIDEQGNATHFAKRSSIWAFTGNSWQMKFHQGTACDPFAIERL